MKKDLKVIRLMNHLFGTQRNGEWDEGSPAHRFWGRWIKKQKKMPTRKLYKLADEYQEHNQ